MREPDEGDMLGDVVPCRGRESLPSTDVTDGFSMRELDALAPLSPEDSLELAEMMYPRDETLANIHRRILAARKLKYGQ